ncbi:unnamed protein product [Adineta steineri]|uniref:Uncharacterized protein n=1 Tax=Adineta steineri TaxID=433720 RepID=A0A814N4S6_9BILA|nr:unnamed protein product [Adineta steineri]CAF1088576.1 unnamed protein product [Adineta steineri]
MTEKQLDLLTNFFQQTHLGKMSLITLIQNLPNNKQPYIPEITYDENGRYLKLKQDDSIRKMFTEKSIQRIEQDTNSIDDIIQQRTSSVLPSSSIEERYDSIAKEFNLSLSTIEKQYELALKNRIEIPPILMRRIIIDAIGILHIMMNELNDDTGKNHEKSKRISKRLKELEAYNKLFDHHC